MKQLRKAVKKFTEFNRKPPKKIVKRQFDFSVPLVKIGRVPVLTYESTKEGKKRQYYHEVKVMGTLYAHPTENIMVIVGGSTKVKDWLYD